MASVGAKSVPFEGFRWELGGKSETLPAQPALKTLVLRDRRVSTVAVQRFCKPKVGGSNPSPGTC